MNYKKVIIVRQVNTKCGSKWDIREVAKEEFQGTPTHRKEHLFVVSVSELGLLILIPKGGYTDVSMNLTPALGKVSVSWLEMKEGVSISCPHLIRHPNTGQTFSGTRRVDMKS